MRCFRLTREPHADFTGTGGLFETGRWHAKPAPIIYTSSSRALALLEVLVHLELTTEQLPDDYVYQVIDIPDDLQTLSRRDIEMAQGTAAFGTAWLEEARSLALSAPSVVVPQEHNIMLNPRHAGIEQTEFVLERDVIWDERLLRPG